MNDIHRATAGDMAALAALARSGGRAGRRARIVLALARGETPSGIVLKTGATYATIRAARRRFEEGGAAALAPRPPARASAVVLPVFPARRRLVPPDVIAAAAMAEKLRGRIPVVRISMETWVRDAIADGTVRPGAVLPSRRDFQRAFRTTSDVVNGVFSSLSKQGFVRSRGGGRTIAASPPPFSGRYLFVGRPRVGESAGYMSAALAATQILERSRGARFDFIGGVEVLESPSKERLRLLAEIRRQRWGGVFFRTWTDQMAAAGNVRIDGVPICIPGNYATSAKGVTGSRVRRIPLAKIDFRDALFADCAAAGCRRVAVFEHCDMRRAFGRADAERAAAERGLELGPWHYHEFFKVGVLDRERDVFRAAMSAVFAPGREWEPDAVVLMDDHWLAPLEDVLLARGAEAARRVRVFCLGNRPAQQEPRLDVHFRGYDLLATLSSFVDWCEAIHAGEKDPPPPALATF